MHSRASRCSDRSRCGRFSAGGFTLLEVLLALAIVAMLAVTGYRALTGMLDGSDQVTRERERWRDLDRFFARFEYDLGHLLPRAYRLGPADFPAVFLEGSALAFVRGSVGEPPQRIGYRQAGSRVELVVWPQLDAPGIAAPTAWPIVDDVAAMEITLANVQGDWVDRWGEAGRQPDDPQLPRGARIVLVLADGTRVERVFALR